MNTWQNEPITDKQRDSIIRMNGELGWNEDVPATKGEAGVTIGKMKTEQKRRELEMFNSASSALKLDNNF
jgi:hypothetical protein